MVWLMARLDIRHYHSMSRALGMRVLCGSLQNILLSMTSEFGTYAIGSNTESKRNFNSVLFERHLNVQSSLSLTMSTSSGSTCLLSKNIIPLHRCFRAHSSPRKTQSHASNPT